ncbi:MAG: hypothetical protein KY445_14470 [Armatimonadetes bacterium]|nr:hypothetical protein [Armatimonadota bacterium]
MEAISAFWQETYRQARLQPLYISEREVTPSVVDIQVSSEKLFWKCA